MNEHAIQHIPESKYCFATDGKTVRLRLRTDRNDNPQKIEVIYGGKYTFATTRETLEMTKGGADRLFRWYTAELKLPDVRLVYVFRIEEKGQHEQVGVPEIAALVPGMGEPPRANAHRIVAAAAAGGELIGKVNWWLPLSRLL